MSQKTILIIGGSVLIVVSVVIGALLGQRRAEQQRIDSQQNQMVEFDSTDTSGFPSREYIEARGKAMRQIQEQKLKERFQNNGR